MAIEITQQPAAQIGIDDCICFKIKNDMAEGGTNDIHKLAWQMCDSSPIGEPLFPIGAVDYPAPGEEISICFQSDVIENALVSSGCPDLSQTTVSVVDEASQGLRFKVWDLLLDGDCIEEPQYINEIEYLFTVVNSACQPCDGEIDLTVPQFLTDRPLQPDGGYSICRNQYDWIYIWIPNNSSSLGLVRIQDNDGTFNQFNLVKGKVNCIPFGSIGSDYISSNATSAQLEVDGIDEIIELTIKDCCCLSKCQIAFLEPKGSFKTWVFDELDTTIITESTEVCKIQSCDLGLAERCKQAGKSLSDITYYEQVSFKREIDWSEKNEKLVKAFFANPNKFIIKNINGEDRLIKFLQTAGSYTIKKSETGCIEFTVTGVFNTELVGAISAY